MKSQEKIVNLFIRLVIRCACRIDGKDLSKLPLKGPYIIVINHINFLEVPLLYLQFLPRAVRAFVKIETWSHPLYKYLAKWWGGIPVNRGKADSSAMREGLETLRRGDILVLAPEGTRSGTGQLQKGFAGVVALAARSRVPIYPVAHFGGERLYRNLKKLRRTRITLRVGTPFFLNLKERRTTQQIRQQAVDQIMLRLARLLPESMHGYYAGREPLEGFLEETK